MYRYVTRCKETSIIIDIFDNVSDAFDALELYELEDQVNSCFEPDFYEVAAVNDNMETIYIY